MSLKLNDVHLKIRPLPTDEEKQHIVDRKLLIDQLTTKLRAIHDLKNTLGWGYFLEDLNNERLDLLQRQLTCNDPTTLAKLVGSQLVIERFTNWVNIITQELEMAAKDLQNDE